MMKKIICIYAAILTLMLFTSSHAQTIQTPETPKIETPALPAPVTETPLSEAIPVIPDSITPPITLKAGDVIATESSIIGVWIDAGESQQKPKSKLEILNNRQFKVYKLDNSRTKQSKKQKNSENYRLITNTTWQLDEQGNFVVDLEKNKLVVKTIMRGNKWVVFADGKEYIYERLQTTQSP